MSVSTNKQLITDYLNSLSGQAKTPQLMAQFVSDPDLVKHIQDVEAGFPGYELIADQMIAEGDLVALRATFRGVHRGAFAGVEPTGRQVAAGVIIVYRIADGRIAQHWLQFDLFGLLGQLKGAPVAETAAA
jgi:predicted ester cyclase